MTPVIKCPVKTRDIHKIEKKSSISVFGYKNKEKYLIYVSKKRSEDEHVDLLLIGKESKRHYLLLEQLKNSNVIFKIYLKLMANKGLKCQN